MNHNMNYGSPGASGGYYGGGGTAGPPYNYGPPTVSPTGGMPAPFQQQPSGPDQVYGNQNSPYSNPPQQSSPYHYPNFHPGYYGNQSPTGSSFQQYGMQQRPRGMMDSPKSSGDGSSDLKSNIYCSSQPGFSPGPPQSFGYNGFGHHHQGMMPPPSGSPSMGGSPGPFPIPKSSPGGMNSQQQCDFYSNQPQQQPPPQQQESPRVPKEESSSNNSPRNSDTNPGEQYPSDSNVSGDTLKQHNSGNSVKDGVPNQPGVKQEQPGDTNVPPGSKPPGGGEESKDFTLKANQSLIESLDSIPELPEIPELKYTDVHDAVSDESQDRSSSQFEGSQKQSPPAEEEGKEEMPSTEYMQHEQRHMEQQYNMHQMQGGPMQPFPVQHLNYGGGSDAPGQQMWNYYGNNMGYHQQQSMYMGGMEGNGGWWGQPAGPRGEYPPGGGGQYRMPAPGPWALRSPRPRAPSRGPGRPPKRSNTATPTNEASFLGGDMVPSPEMMAVPSRKRGPGRPRAGGAAVGLMDPATAAAMGGPDAVAAAAAAVAMGGKTKSVSGNNNKKRYTCEICQKRFSTAWYVRVHRKSHNGERPYICHNCGKGFMLPNVLQVHLRKCEKNNPPSGRVPPDVAPSPRAPSPRASPTSLPQNLPPGASQPYPPSDPFQGGSNFPMPGYDQRYMGPPVPSSMSPYPPPPGPPDLAQHYPAPPPEDFPGYMQPSPSQMSSPSPFPPGGMYSPTAMGNPPHSDQTTSSSGHFLANERPRDKGGGCDEKPIPPGVIADLYCAMCEVQFEDKPALEDHLKTHRPYSCEVCEKRFSQKCNLITHMRLHTGEKPYPCSFCDKRFTQKGNLDAHLKTHTKEKPYPCTVCSKKFAFKSSMLSHMKQNHATPIDDDDDDINSIKQQIKFNEYNHVGGYPPLPLESSPLDQMAGMNQQLAAATASMERPQTASADPDISRATPLAIS